MLDQIELRYGEGSLTVPLSGAGRVDAINPNDLPPARDARAEVRRAMAEPIGGPTLADCARGKRSAAIVVDDMTRPVPTHLMLRPIVEELLAQGMSQDRIVVVAATGLHRALSEREMDVVRDGLDLRVISHDARDAAGLATVGTTRGGSELVLNRAVVEADLRILTGDIEFHQFVGYGGGAKSVLPGICDAESVRRTHARMEEPGTGPGRLEGNPVRMEIEEAADLLGVDFMLNVVLNGSHEVVQAFAGDVHEAFRAGTRIVDAMYKAPVADRYDVVIASPGGYPKDVELYQSQKAVASAARIVREGGRIVVFAECREGHGSELAFAWAREASSPRDIVGRFRKQFVMGGHKAYQLARDVLRAEVYLYSELPEALARTFFLRPIADVNAIGDLIEPGASVAVLPQASLTLPVLT